MIAIVLQADLTDRHAVVRILAHVERCGYELAVVPDAAAALRMLLDGTDVVLLLGRHASLAPHVVLAEPDNGLGLLRRPRPLP